jgi:hypothetical protein
MRLLWEASARDNAPQSPIIDIKVNEGRAVLAFEDGSVLDRTTRSSWNAMFRPHGRSQIVTIVQPKKQEISWTNKNALEFQVSSAKTYREQLAKELGQYAEILSRLEAEVTGSGAPSKRKVSFASVQQMEEKRDELESSRKMFADLEKDLAALDWALEHLPKEGSARMPTMIPARMGQRIEIFGTPSLSDINNLLGRYTRYQKRYSPDKIWEAMIVQAPREAVALNDKGTLVPKAMPQEVAAPLATWFRVVRTGPMSPSVRDAWAWSELLVAWNSLHIGVPIGLPKGIRVPSVQKPSGNVRVQAKVEKTTSTVNSLRKMVEHLASTLEALQKTSVPSPAREEKEPVWWSTWQVAGGWMANLGASFTRFPNSHPDPRFSFLVTGKDGRTPMSWEFFASHTTTKWTPPSQISHEYLAKLVAELLPLWGGDTLNRYLSSWWAGPTSQAKYLEPTALPFLREQPESLQNPVVYSSSKGTSGLWPAMVFATGGVSSSAKSHCVLPPDLNLEQVFKEFIASGDQNWPLDDLTKDCKTVSAVFASIDSMRKILEQSQRGRVDGWKQLISEIATLQAAASVFEKAAWSIVRADALSASSFDAEPWTNLERDTRFAAALEQFVEAGEETAAEFAAGTEDPPVVPEEPQQEGVPPVVLEEVPMTLEMHGLTYHLLEESDLKDPTPQGVVLPAVVRNGFVYVHGRLQQAPRRKTKTASTILKGENFEILVAGPDWAPLPGVPRATPETPRATTEEKGKAPQRGAEPAPTAEQIYAAMTGDGPEPSAETPKVKIPAGAKSQDKAPKGAGAGPKGPAPTPPKAQQGKTPLPPKFPGRSSATQMADCKCDMYPCMHTKSNIRSWHVNAKLPTTMRPRDSKDGKWKTDDLDWPKRAEDPLAKTNPLKVDNLPKPFHGDRIPEDLLKKARQQLKLSDEPLPQGFSKLPKEERKRLIKERALPRWVSAALSADPMNLAKIVDGTMTKDTPISGAKPRAQNKAGAKEQTSKSPPLSLGERWAKLRKRFNDVHLWLDPVSPREKQLRAAFDALKKSVPQDQWSTLPKLRKRPRSLGSGTSPTSGPAPTGMSELSSLLTMAKMLGEIVKALNPK